VNFPSSKIVKTALAGVLAGTALAASATAASADIVCNHWSECWHVHSRIVYPAEVGGVWHTDHWYKAHAHDPALHWRTDRYDHGYYRNGIWVAF